jgi:hypothetical protein
MSNERTAVVLFAVFAAFVTTLERADTGTANNDTPPGTTGLAKPHPPLDRSPGQPVLGLPAGDRSSLETGSPRTAVYESGIGP